MTGCRTLTRMRGCMPAHRQGQCPGPMFREHPPSFPATRLPVPPPVGYPSSASPPPRCPCLSLYRPSIVPHRKHGQTPGSGFAFRLPRLVGCANRQTRSRRCENEVLQSCFHTVIIRLCVPKRLLESSMKPIAEEPLENLLNEMPKVQGTRTLRVAQSLRHKDRGDIAYVHIGYLPCPRVRIPCAADLPSKIFPGS